MADDDDIYFLFVFAASFLSDEGLCDFDVLFPPNDRKNLFFLILE